MNPAIKLAIIVAIILVALILFDTICVIALVADHMTMCQNVALTPFANVSNWGCP